MNSDGTLDTSFNPGASNPVRSFALQQDGKIIVVGDFETIGGGGTGTIPRRKIARLNNDGSVDASFDPGANNPIWSVSLQSDEKLLVSGSFSALGGGTGTTARNGMGRINPDGTLDNAFSAPEAISAQAFALQADQKIILGGQFGSVDEMSTTPNYIARLHPLGSLDPEFTPGANNTVYALALQNDGMLVAGGDFTTLGRGGRGQDTRRRIGRLSNTSIAVQQLSINPANTAITWIRSDTSPEIYSATFESSQDGTNYSLLGNGLRTVGGWQLTGLMLESEDRFIRTRGFYTTGLHNGSVSIVEFIKDRGPVRATISGRLLTPTGLGLRNASVFLTNAQGIRRSATTSSFGVYSFENVSTGENYLVTASSKRYRFAPRNVQISTDLVNFDLFGLE